MTDLFKRSKLNPILKPDPKHEWESLKVYNPGAIYHAGKFHLFYRAVGKGVERHSAIGYAVSEDGERFMRFDEPILDRESNNPTEYRGLEDPRITKIGGVFYMVYAAYDGSSVRLCIATSKDLKKWIKHPPTFKNFLLTRMGGVFVEWREGKPIEITKPKKPEFDIRTKSGGIFPEKIRGKYWMLFNEYRIWLAQSENLINWEALPRPFLEPRKGTGLFDNIFVEMGPPPIKTKKGWLVLYHGVNDAIQYHVGVLLLDLKDPRRILFRSQEAIFGPKEKYELAGVVDILPGAMKLVTEGKEKELKRLLKRAEMGGFMPQVTFVTSAVMVNGIIRLFYGAGDQFVCTATAKVEDILSIIH